ncbi:MAG: hypothetical protein AAF493_13450 [Pseudomonadota bacterium]
MRYRVGEEPVPGSYAGTDEVVILTVVISLFVGIILTWLGIRGRQTWLVVSCGPLIIASIVYLVWSLA